MVYNRTGYAPWSLTRAAGVQSATVDGTIEVPQYIQPTLNTGFVDEKGNWKGVKSSDETFNIRSVDEAIPNGTAILTPTTNADGSWPLDMTGYRDIFIAILTTEAGNYEIQAVMGPQAVDGGFAGLTPVNPAAKLRGNAYPQQQYHSDFEDLFDEGAEALTADVWNIFIIENVLKSQKLLQFKIKNNTGSEAAKIETAFMRIV